MQTRVDNFRRVTLCEAYLRVKRGKYRIAISVMQCAMRCAADAAGWLQARGLFACALAVPCFCPWVFGGKTNGFIKTKSLGRVQGCKRGVKEWVDEWAEGWADGKTRGEYRV
jgi:hypothetical protein